jgi:signal peptidase II
MTSHRKILSRLLMVAITASAIAADRWTKALVERRIPERTIVPVVRGFFNLTNTQNSGAVFGIFSDLNVWWKMPLLIGISIALLAVVVTLVVRTRNMHWATSIGLSLILGGALSNLYDRMHAGTVEDFLDFYIRSYHWATFNVADSAIVVGTGLIILQVMLDG